MAQILSWLKVELVSKHTAIILHVDVLFVAGIARLSGFPIAATIVIILIVCVILVVLVVILFVVILRFYKRRAYGKLFNFDIVCTTLILYPIDTRVPEGYFEHTPLNQFNVATVTTAAQNVKDSDELTVESRFNLKRIDLNKMAFLRMNSSHPTELITFVESAIKPSKFERGFAFYEFLYKEDISDAQEIIFMSVRVV